MISIIILNDDYFLTRKIHKYQGCLNLHRLSYDREKAEEGLKCLGETNTQHYNNISFEEFSEVTSELAKDL